MKIENKNTQERYSLPSEVRYCTKCTISNQRPRITFDSDGVCSACNFNETKKKMDWASREAELLALFDKHRRNDGSYDILVPCSGGKDAAYIAHEVKHKYGMNPLTCTWAPNIYTDIGFKNLQNMVQEGDLANILGKPSGRTHRLLTKMSFEILGDPFQPFIYGQTNFPMQIAAKFGIPLIMYGENGEVEYGGDMKNANIPTRDYRADHTKHYFSGLAPEDFVDYGLDSKDIIPYMPPPNEELDKINTEIHFYGYYKHWTPQENFYYCVDNTGFAANPIRSEGTFSKYASLDDQIDGFHYYLAYIKFGLGRCTSDTAQEIRNGHLTREEGVRLVEKFDGEFPAKYFKVFLDFCDISEDYFFKVIDSWRSKHLWGKDQNGDWKLRHNIAGTGLND